MLNENIRTLRKAKGLSQEALAIKLSVVRQTVSKWEKGLSVPDSSMLITLADELDTSVSILLGETVSEEYWSEDNLKNISEKLEVINLQLAKRSEMRIRFIRASLISVCAGNRSNLYRLGFYKQRVSDLGLSKSGVSDCRNDAARF